MQEGDHKNQQESSHEVGNYLDVVKVLSEVELPSTSSALASSCTLTTTNNVITFHEGQSSGTKRKADDIEGIITGNKEQKREQHDFEQSAHRENIATKINATEKRRRSQISERIRALRALVPYCNKRDKTSILGDAIDYIKFLQTQVQMMQSMGVGTISQGLHMYLTRQPNLQVPNVAPYLTMSPLIDMQHGIPQFGSYVPLNFPFFAPSFFGFPPLMPPMEVGTESFALQEPRPILYPQQLQFLSQTTFQSMYPAAIPFAGTIIPTTCSEAESTVPVRPSYHTPETSQGTQ